MFSTGGNETICALSTASGMGAIAVLRLSGPDAFHIVDKIFTPAEKNFSVDTVQSHTVHFGILKDSDGDILDEVLVTIFRNPHSYTGEDVVEISCHGSVFIQQKILELLYKQGARQAEPGEFTLRAFMNRKFDLAQAEAVADLISSRSQSSHDLAMQQMRGGYSKKMKELRSKLIDFTSLIELELDFSEENVEFADRSSLLELLDQISAEISQLISSFTLGNVIKNGIPVAIIGKPNVGKSTLLNAILNEERALVSEIPGTTRDTIEDTVDIGGYTFRFIDTAGLRESDDLIESMGIERTKEKMEQSAVILHVFDATEGISLYPPPSPSLLVRRGTGGVDTDLPVTRHPSPVTIYIGNKADLLKEYPKEPGTIYISAKNGSNIHDIHNALLDFVKRQNITGSTVVSNARHLEALQNAANSITSIRDGLASGISPDLLTVDIRLALHHLGTITGEIGTEDILGNIFGKFCVGK